MSINSKSPRFFCRIALLCAILLTVKYSLSGYSSTSDTVLKKVSWKSTTNNEDSPYELLEAAQDLLNHGQSIPAYEKLMSTYEKENATFVSLVRNDETDSMAASIRHVEDRFNRFFHYDWVFLNDEPFDDEFVRMARNHVSGEAKFGYISPQDWDYPDFIDRDFAAWGRQQLMNRGVIYADSESYRKMCRYESGYFYRHDLMKDYRYYWRVEPNVRYHCDIGYDVFRYMRENNVSYGFTISLLEFPVTVQTLWNTTLRFLDEYPHLKHNNSLWDFMVTDGEYNFCHFWSNFEIADMDFWRGEAYSKYFEYLDQSGGFFYERWGDAPVHSMAASLFLDKDQIHFFEDIGYEHPPYQHCPEECNERGLHCMCNQEDSFDWELYSCLPHYFKAKGEKLPSDVNIRKVKKHQKAWTGFPDDMIPKSTADDKTGYLKEKEENARIEKEKEEMVKKMEEFENQKKE